MSAQPHTPCPSDGPVFSRRLTVLSVSWLHHQFKAVALHRGVLQGTWEHPGPTTETHSFDQLLRQAVLQTGYRGQAVSVVLAHPRLVPHLAEVPPVQGAARQKILQRLVQQQQVFTGEAAWACQSSFHGKQDSRLLLHLLPKPFLDQLIEGCRRNRLQLQAVVPVLAVLQQQLRQLPLDKAEVGVLAAETGGSTSVLAATRDGQLLLGRTLSGNWNENPERLGLDLNRTLHFVHQQYGAVLNHGLWLFGPGAAEHLPALRQRVQFGLQLSPVADHPFYWALEVLRLRSAQLANLIPPEQLQAPQRHLFAKVVGLAAGLVFLATLAACAYALAQARTETANIKSLSTQLHRLEARQADLRQRQLRLAHQDLVARLVLDETLRPVPLWFLGYLSETVPSDLVITNLHLKREENLWKVRLSGMVQAAVQAPTPAALSNSVAQLSASLAKGPFHVQLVNPQQREREAVPLKGGPLGSQIPAWVAGLANGGTETKALPLNQFSLEGTIP